MLHRVIDDARTRHANIDHRFRLADAVKRAGHERIVFDRVGEADELGAGQAALIARALGSSLINRPTCAHRIHVDSGARGRHVHRRAKPFGGRQSFGNRIEKIAFDARAAFVDQRRVAADEIHADRAAPPRRSRAPDRPDRRARLRSIIETGVMEMRLLAMRIPNLVADLVDGFDQTRGGAFDLFARALGRASRSNRVAQSRRLRPSVTVRTSRCSISVIATVCRISACVYSIRQSFRV